MTKQRWNNRILLRYTLLQLPELAAVGVVLILARKWLDIPSWVAWGLVFLWAVKDVILFPLIWRAYDWDHVESKHPMEGATGVTVEPLDPSGYIRISGELWRAEIQKGEAPMSEGESVRIKGARGLTLLVKREEENIEGGEHSEG